MMIAMHFTKHETLLLHVRDRQHKWAMMATLSMAIKAGRRL